MSHAIGYQYPNRYPSLRGSGGPLRFHAKGCSVDGGRGLPRGVCRKCVEQTEHAYEVALTELDRRANRGR